MQATQQHTSTLAIICLLVAATMWGLLWYPLRILEGYGISGLWSTFYIYSGTMLVAIPIFIHYRRELLLQPYHLLAIMICSGWCNTAFILALVDGQIVRVILLFYLSPIWSTLLARFVLKEHITPGAYFIVLLALIGAMTMLWSPEVGYPWPQDMADWLAISSGVAFAFTNMFINISKQLSIQLKSTVSWSGALLIASLILLFSQEQVINPTAEGIWIAIVLGLVGMTIMTLCVVYGVTHMPIYRSAVILLFEVFIGGLSAFLLTSERLSYVEWAGGLIVILAAYLSARQQKQTVKINN